MQLFNAPLKLHHPRIAVESWSRPHQQQSRHQHLVTSHLHQHVSSLEDKAYIQNRKAHATTNKIFKVCKPSYRFKTIQYMIPLQTQIYTASTPAMLKNCFSTASFLMNSKLVILSSSLKAISFQLRKFG